MARNTRTAAAQSMDAGMAILTSGTNPDGTLFTLPVNVVNGAVYDDSGNLCTVKTAFANVQASQTDANVVTAVASKKIRVLALIIECGGTATTVVFNSKPSGAGTAISMTFQNAANGGAAPSAAPGGFWFQTNAGEGLSATTGAGSTTGIQVVYIEAA